MIFTRFRQTILPPPAINSCVPRFIRVGHRFVAFLFWRVPTSCLAFGDSGLPFLVGIEQSGTVDAGPATMRW